MQARFEIDEDEDSADVCVSRGLRPQGMRTQSETSCMIAVAVTVRRHPMTRHRLPIRQVTSRSQRRRLCHLSRQCLAFSLIRRSRMKSFTRARGPRCPCLVRPGGILGFWCTTITGSSLTPSVQWAIIRRRAAVISTGSSRRTRLDISWHGCSMLHAIACQIGRATWPCAMTAHPTVRWVTMPGLRIVGTR